MTELLNKEAFFNEVDSLLKNVQDERISLVMLALGNLEYIKGYQEPLISKEVNLKVMRIVKLYEDKDSIYGKYGRSQFALLFKNHSIIKVIAICEGIREHLIRSTLKGTKDKPITISMGIVTYTSHIKDSSEFIMLAEQAISEAKKAGQNKIIIR